VLLDWHAASAGHPELFWRDGHHIHPHGAPLYVALLTDALRASHLPKLAAR
jgi:hypothetical protein